MKVKEFRFSSGDIDIDTPSSFDPSDLFKNWVRASLVKDGKLVPHPSGYYPANIPKDPITGLSSIPYNEAEALGYSKIDFLHLSIYNYVKDRADLEQLANSEPDWNLLLLPSVQTRLFQLSNHGQLLDEIRPKSIQDLADCLALIRPGKREILPIYKKDKQVGRRMLWAKSDNDAYTFKKSHAISYALVIVVQLNLIANSRITL